MIKPIRKRIVTDEAMHPVAVQIDYKDWIKIEKFLNLKEKKIVGVDLWHHSGVISLKEDPLAFQSRIRGEWR